MSRVCFGWVVAIATVGHAGEAAAQTPDYSAVPQVFRTTIGPGQTREQFVYVEMAAFRMLARRGVELDRASIARLTEIQSAGRRFVFLRQFLASDIDGDGTITRSEAEDTAWSGPRGGGAPAGSIEHVMALDANRDGVVDAAELSSAADQQVAGTPRKNAGDRADGFLELAGDNAILRAADAIKAAERAFDIVDRDGDTVVSPSEWRSFAEAIGLPVARRKLADDPDRKPKPPPPSVRSSTEEAYLVGVYEGFSESGGAAHGPRALLTVDRPGKQVTLLLCSYSSLRWQVTLTPGTILKEVRTFGSPTSEVQVDDVAAQPLRMEIATGCPDGRARPAFYQFVRSLKALTGFERLSGYAGAYNAPVTGFAFDRVGGEPDLAPGNLKAPNPDRLPAIRFQATLSQGAGLYDLAGRLIEKDEQADGAMSVDLPARDERYSIRDDGLARRPIKGSGAPKTILLSLDVPPLSWPSGVAYDSKRDRIVIVSLGGDGLLYEYAIATDRWRVIANMQNRDVNGLFYDAKADRFWGVNGTFGPEALVSLTPDGEVDRTIEIDPIKLPGLTDVVDPENGGGSTLRLAGVEDGKAILITSSGSGEPGPFRIYLLDLASGAALTSFKD